MSKTTKLYKYLDNLEDEFLEILLEEFNRIVKGYYSSYLENKYRKWYVAINDRTEYIERKENKIKALRVKLGESPDGSSVIIANYFAKIRNETKNNRSIDKPLALLFIEQLLNGKRSADEMEIDYSHLKSGTKRNRPKYIMSGQKPDNIRPKKNYYFSIKPSEVYRLIDKHRIKTGYGNEFVSFKYANPKKEKYDYGFILADIVPRRNIRIYSIPNSIPIDFSKKMINEALEMIADINKNYGNRKRTLSVCFYFFLNESSELITTKHQIKYQRRKYRSTDKFSTSYKPKIKQIKEEVISVRTVRI